MGPGQAEYCRRPAVWLGGPLKTIQQQQTLNSSVNISEHRNKPVFILENSKYKYEGLRFTYTLDLQTYGRDVINAIFLRNRFPVDRKQ